MPVPSHTPKASAWQTFLATGRTDVAPAIRTKSDGDCESHEADRGRPEPRRRPHVSEAQQRALARARGK
ncbi:hypothetical protein [Desulfocurvibacter africanus]|uniref:hypothetical protein n=1 Tax=Desulfocurvibacter africanus TaxID=873 RepID=UPI000417DB30|nr:hypothetical protein [Desulfocurvibacter africanus]